MAKVAGKVETKIVTTIGLLENLQEGNQLVGVEMMIMTARGTPEMILMSNGVKLIELLLLLGFFYC